MKKIISIALAISVLFLFIPFNIASAKGSAPSVAADGAVLMDATTGTVLYSKNMDSAFPPASTTKLMTVLLTLENCKLDDVVKVGKIPPQADGSKIYIFEGEELTVNDLLHAVLLVSANDCAEALAEHVGGSIDSFAKLMNKRAKELGCEDTNFVNPTGLYDNNHRTSAKDLALIMRELIKHPEFSEIATTESYSIQPTNKCDKVRPLWNENKLIQKGSRVYYPGCIGGKTGYTIQSLHSYVCAATRNNQTLIVAFIHDNDKQSYWQDATNLLNYGFNNFELDSLYTKGEKVTDYSNNGLNIPLLASDDFYYIKEKGSDILPTFKIVDKNISKQSFKKGDPILNANITYNNEPIGALTLAAGADHIINPISGTISNKNTLYKAISIAFYSLAGIVVLLRIRKRIVRTRKKKTRL